MVPPLKKFHPGPVLASTLNEELAKLVLNVIGDGLIEAKRVGQEITVSLNLRALLALLPKFVDNLFIADITWDGGGSDGTTATRASWTYTVKRLGVTVATGVQPERNRPIGSMIQGDLVPGSTKHGLCFYGSDGTVHLWDAGEVESTDPACP